MGLKIFGPGGIDQKSNHLLRDPRKLRDAKNVKLNSHLEYVKRDGRIQDPTFTSSTYNDVIYSRSSDEYLFRKSGEYYAIKNGVERQVYKYFDPTQDETSLISHAEYLNTALFTHEKETNGTAKYDGNAIYRAGLPTPKSTASAGSGYMVTFFEFLDSSGNLMYGPSTITPVASGSLSVTFDTLFETGFKASYIKPNIGSTTTISNTNRSLNILNLSPDCSYVGAKIPIRNRGTAIVISDPSNPNRGFSDTFVILEVENYLAGVITFTANSFKNLEIVLDAAVSGFNIHGGTVLRVAFSDEETTGYTTHQASSLNGVLVDNSSASQVFLVTFNSQLDSLLSDIYDITTSKLRPPRCKYVAAFGDQIVCGGVLSFYDFENKETSYINNDLVMYSDISNGDLGENFSEINRQLIGDTYDGQISGLVRFKDSMIVFKDTSIYSLDGVLTPGQYGLRRIESNEIGCLSFKSIIAIDKYVLFQGQDGVYSLNGYKAEKITTLLDPFFSTINPSLTRAVVYNKDDQYIFNTNMGMVVVDYEYNELFIWDNVANCKGLIVDKNRELRMFDATRCLINQSLKNDLGTTAINAYIETAWFDLKEPSLLKKATDLRIFSLNNAGQVLTFRTYRDWDTSKVKGPFLIDMSSANTKTVLRKLDIEQAQSISIKIENNIVNEDMNISGYELLIDVIQSKDKNVK